ncbi:SH2 domain-containing adapter protein D isoform X1 [Dermacentor andersoni]|uniref:SH2 domain-containing adapter protein D isoform X1 n=1 Tax=Dermacentor andersoni TaxID=34620 RepID=UPI0021552B97|nr:SH2 domain-containing adapter protein F-like [Dermacentor andersoni]
MDGRAASGADDDNWSWDTDFEDDSGYEVPLQAGDYEPIGWPPQHSANFERSGATLSRPLPPVPPVQQQEDPGGDPPWLVHVERADAERLLSGARDGSFVVRPSRGEAPFALSLRFGGRPFHLRVRRRADGRLALGSEKPRERSFDSLAQLVEHHCREPILLTSRGRPAGRTTLAPPSLTCRP